MNKFEAFKNLFFDNSSDTSTGVTSTTSTGWTMIPANSDDSEQEIKKYHSDYIREADNEELGLMLMQNELDMERMRLTRKQIMDEMDRRGITKSSDDEEDEEDEEETVEKTYKAPGRGKSNRPLVAFVGSSPSKIDIIRDRPFSGIIGKTMREKYVEPLGIPESAVYMTNIVKTFCADGHGSACEPSAEQIKEALPEFVEEMKQVNPHFIVALGKTASEAIGQIAEEWVPHPRALNIHSDTGEVGRKMSRLAKKAHNRRPPRTISGEIKKFDEEKQIVYGVVMEPMENDTDENWTIPGEIEDAAHFFMKNFRLIDAEHSREEIDAYPVESYIAPDDTVINDKPVKKGSWVMGVKVEDPNEWAKVKKGDYTGFSIDASAYIDPTMLLDK